MNIIKKLEEIDFKIKKFSKIYDYYEYTLGPADKISLILPTLMI